MYIFSDNAVYFFSQYERIFTSWHGAGSLEHGVKEYGMRNGECGKIVLRVTCFGSRVAISGFSGFHVSSWFFSYRVTRTAHRAPNYEP